MKKSVVQLALNGFVFFAVVCNIMSYIISGFDYFVSPVFVEAIGNPQAALLIQTLVCGLFGALTIGTTQFYEIECWPLAKATALHWLVVAGGYIPVAFGLRWIDSIRPLIVIEAFMLAGYFMIWLVICAVYRAQVKELNELQQEYINSKDKHFEGGMTK